jgi:uncharacterized protein with ParB-like and HNH nuclease domain
MSATLFKEVNYSLSKLIADIDMGEIGLPELQRPFVWPNSKVRDLFDSMYKGFPVGYLLFWANGTGSGHKQIGTDAKQKIPRLLIVDGQQRLTSLYSVIKGLPVIRENYKPERICIAFRPRDQKFEVADAAIQRDPEFIPDISVLWSSEIPRNRFVKEFFRKLRDSRYVSEDEEDRLEFIGNKKTAMEKPSIPKENRPLLAPISDEVYCQRPLTAFTIYKITLSLPWNWHPQSAKRMYQRCLFGSTAKELFSIRQISS